MGQILGFVPLDRYAGIIHPIHFALFALVKFLDDDV
jgi:hypothetical protein